MTTSPTRTAALWVPDWPVLAALAVRAVPARGPGARPALVLRRRAGRGTRRAHGRGHAGEHAVARAEGVQG